ncbi:MAG TPA: type II secretion system F family protein, partial [Gaiellales bacterium]|nr:type II secretion system F family protein [Gaiellales bacterium]
GQLPVAAETLAAHVRAGRSIAQAIAGAAADLPWPISEAAAEAAAEVSLGAAPADALGRLGDGDDVALLVAAVRLQSRAGGDLASVLEGLAEVVHMRVADRRAAEVATAQARYTGRMVSAMPGFGLAALWLVDRPGLHMLFSTPLGWASLGLSALLAAAGDVLIRRIARAAA